MLNNRLGGNNRLGVGNNFRPEINLIIQWTPEFAAAYNSFFNGGLGLGRVGLGGLGVLGGGLCGQIGAPSIGLPAQVIGFGYTTTVAPGALGQANPYSAALVPRFPGARTVDTITTVKANKDGLRGRIHGANRPRPQQVHVSSRRRRRF
ncbi:unnamed protein product [Didymodactylos carnosus]|uniref:Uncharacterized protein n=1 Tax=Didymodactylos carnosus TaxID=1234261 RepID=A0A814X375_9BILA|nr:unnamed protein product [Didymodactylos carnosus]CAF3976407.1 unnamed protein product [Didymodactylos carnosus]